MTKIHLIEALEVVREVMDDDSLTIRNVVDKVSGKSGKTVEEILGGSPKAEVVFLRHGVYYIFSERFKFSNGDIAYLTIRPGREGTRGPDYKVHHKTVMSGVKRIKRGFIDHEEHLI